MKVQRWYALALMLLVLLAPASSRVGAGQAPAVDAPFARIPLVVGRSHVLATEFDVVRIAVTNPAIADATVVQPREVLIDGKGAGTVSLVLWGSDRRVQYDVVVRANVPPLQEQLQLLFPDEDIRVTSTEEVVVLSGVTSSNDVSLRATEIAEAASSKQKVINMLQRPSGPNMQQVMLEVQFAEVERNALLSLGANLLANGPDLQAGTSTQQSPVPFIDESTTGQIGRVLQVPDYLNVFFFWRRENLLATIRALQQRGLFQSLAEPNLVAYNGQEASFLAGGEFPIPLVSGNSGQVTVLFKEFGVKLNFRPSIAGDVVRLKVKPEVSTLDFSNGLLLDGFRIPALKVRRAETEVELRDGQTFAIAGLLDNQAVEDKQAVPFLSSLPIVGHLFKSKADSARRTELLVLITPHLVRTLDVPKALPLPVDQSKFLAPEPRAGEKKDDSPKEPKP